MRFTLEIDLDDLSGEPAAEVGRILRYWAGGVTDETLVPGSSQDVYDSAFTKVGTWTVSG